jgi:hypothetical protein
MKRIATRIVRRIVTTGILALVTASGCGRRGDDPPIVVEADTLRSLAMPEGDTFDAERASMPEVVVIEEPAVPSRPLEPEPDPGGSGAQVREEPAPSGQASSEGPAAEVDASPLMLPAGTRLALELRTPLHSATIRVGDRFAARSTRSVVLGSRTAIEPGALVEGRVAGVTRADDDEPGRIELDFRTLVLTSGERLPLEAEIASVAGRDADMGSGPRAGQVIGGAGAGAGVGGVMGGRKGAVIGAVVGAVGAVLIAGASDHEVVVSSGTPIEITLRAPIELPAP